MESLLLIDFSWLYNKYYFVAKYNYSTEPNKDLNPVVLRMLEQFLSLVEKSYKGSRIILALDSPTSSLKNFELCKDYKQNRDKEGKKEVYKGLNYILAELIKYLNPKTFAFVKAKSYEADQIIAHFVKKYHDKYRVIIFSGDKDLLQLTWYSNVFASDKFKNGRFLLKSDEEIFEKFKNSKGEDFTRISENKRDILKYRTLKGDPSDNLSSVFPRIKDKEIAVILGYWTDENPLTEESVYNVLSVLQFTHKALANKLEANKEVWIRNYKIMSLFEVENIKITRVK